MKEPDIHILKCWPLGFAAIWTGNKRFEIRKADRDFKVGDKLKLCEWDPKTEKYSGWALLAEIAYITAPGQWGLPADLCVMSIKDPEITSALPCS